MLRDFTIKTITGAGISTASYLIGGWDAMISTLALFMGLDVVTGWLKGAYLGELSSKIAFKSIMIKKLGILIAIVVAHQLDKVGFSEFGAVLPFESPARTAMVIFFIGMEFISINENIAHYVPLPEWWKKLFKEIKGGISKNE